MKPNVKLVYTYQERSHFYSTELVQLERRFHNKELQCLLRRLPRSVVASDENTDSGFGKLMFTQDDEYTFGEVKISRCR